MGEPVDKMKRTTKIVVSVLAWMFTVGIAIAPAAMAGETEAKALLSAMTDYVSTQKTISFDYDVNLEVVTKEHQKLTLASSGRVNLSRPDKIRATRSGGFADIEMVFDGQTVTLLGKTMNIYTQVGIPGSIDHLVDELKDKYARPLPPLICLLLIPTTN
jgi:hypothetical protein